MTSKRMIVWIPELYSETVVHLSYNRNGSYAIRDFNNREKRGKNVYEEILPLIKWKMNASGNDFVSVTNVDYWRVRLNELSNQIIGKNIERPLIKSKAIKSSTVSKTEKHTKIMCLVEDIFKQYYPNYHVFLGDHGIGSHGTIYRDAEKKSKRAYYSLKMYKSVPPVKGHNVKDPDCIVLEGRIIKYVIEIKWGYLNKYPDESTDISSVFSDKELRQILDSIDYAKCCRVRGPYVSDGDEIRGKFTRDFLVDENTKYLIISDLKGLRENKRYDYNSIKSRYNNLKDLFEICDIEEDVDIFCSLENSLKK